MRYKHVVIYANEKELQEYFDGDEDLKNKYESGKLPDRRAELCAFIPEPEKPQKKRKT